MKKSRFSDNQIVNILKQAEQGVPIAELCREHNIRQSTFYNWRSKYGGMDASLIARLKELEVEVTAYIKRCMPKSVSNQTYYRMPCQKSGSAAWAQSVGLSLY